MTRVGASDFETVRLDIPSKGVDDIPGKRPLEGEW